MSLVYARDIHGFPVELARGTGKFQFVFFASAKCPICRGALQSLQTFAESNHRVTETVMVCRGREDDVMSFSKGLVSALKVVADSKGAIGRRLRIGATPFALLIDGGGLVRAKGSPVSDMEFAWFRDRIEDASGLQQVDIAMPVSRRTHHVG